MTDATALTPAEIRIAFECATRSMTGAAERWQANRGHPIPDDRLEARLRFEIGIYGGIMPAPGTEDLYVEYEASGLRIWAARNLLPRHRMKPVLQGVATLRYAREHYGIPDPAAIQLRLL